MNESEILSKLKQAGVPMHDAKVLADCIVTRKSCSWVNTDEVSKDAVRSLLELIQKENYRIDLSIKTVATRNKYIWEVKVLD